MQSTFNLTEWALCKRLGFVTEIEQNEQLTPQTTEEIIEGNLLLPWQIKPY